MKTIPKPRKDGLCANPDCRQPRQIPKGSWAREEAAKDPWCSATCARKFFGTELPDTMQQRAAKTRDGGT